MKTVKVAKDDVVLNFYDDADGEHGSAHLTLRIASQNGQALIATLQERLTRLLRKDVTVSVQILPSRFMPCVDAVVVN